MQRASLIALTAVALAGILALPASRADASDHDGFLYGRVVTESGTEYQGFLRWGKQEHFWDDLFHSLKEDLPYRDEVEDLDLVDERREDRRGRVRVFNWKIEWSDDGISGSRVFIARFGDIEEIRVTGGEDAELTMRNGEHYDVSGYSDDVGGSIHVQDDELGEIDLKWERIESITFLPVPSGADPGVHRLYGTVETEVGDFEGWIMWDKEECVSSDLLDGESEDGDMSIEMGRIASIERRGRSSSIVEMSDGRKIRLRGSNDVDDDNRGIMVEDERFGKVTVSWDAFDRVEFSSPSGSGRGYDDYEALGPLVGRIFERGGHETSGRIVYDLDEAEGWEMLNGRMRDVEFDIPMANIREIEPIDDDESRVTLRNGEVLELSDSQDVSDRHDGFLVYPEGGGDPVYIAWDDLDRVRFGN
jgi:hypothetical protein